MDLCLLVCNGLNILPEQRRGGGLSTANRKRGGGGETPMPTWCNKRIYSEHKRQSLIYLQNTLSNPNQLLCCRDRKWCKFMPSGWCVSTTARPDAEEGSIGVLGLFLTAACIIDILREGPPTGRIHNPACDRLNHLLPCPIQPSAVFILSDDLTCFCE